MIFLGACLWLPAFAVAQEPEIIVSSGSDSLSEAVRGNLQVSAEPCDSRLPRLQRLRPGLRESINNSLNALGYYEAEFSLNFQEGEACWGLRVDVQEGPRVVFDDIQVSIAGEAGNQTVFLGLAAQPGIVSGEPLRHEAFEKLKSALSALAVENGFFNARFQQSELRLDLARRQADAIIVFDPGPRYYFGRLNIDTGGALSETLIRGLLTISEEMPYSSSLLLSSRQSLNDSQYFSEVNLSPRIARAENYRIPLNVRLTPRPRRVYSSGIGFTTDTGSRVSLGYEDRYINKAGHRLTADSTLSTVRQQVNLNYSLPLARNPGKENLNISGGFIQEETDTYLSERYLLEFSHRKQQDNGWLRNRFVNIQEDRFQITRESRRSNLLVLGSNYSRTRADDAVRPRRGWRLFAQLKGAASGVFSDLSFLQFYGSAKYIHPLGEKGRLISRLELGGSWAPREDELPASLRFFSGGDQSVRGYDYQSLGPADESGEVVGGRHLVVGSVEYDYLIKENWRLAAFYDSGNAFSVSGDLALKESFGFGIRWLSPVGPIRLDLAKPLQGQDSFRIHITMGPDL